MDHDVKIRRYQPDDVDAIYTTVIESKPELSIWMPWCHDAYAKQDTQVWVEGRPDAWKRNDEWSFLIVNSRNELLGSCGIHRIDMKNGVAELGYWVRTSVTGRGIATEATRQLCRWAFEEAGLHRIEILAAVENVISQRVAEKVGAVREGMLRERIVLNERRHDCVLYSILKDEFRQ